MNALVRPARRIAGTLAVPGDKSVSHRAAMLGAIAQAEHRFSDAADHLTNAAASSVRLGFVGQAAYHLTKLGRVQHQSGANAEAIATLEQAIEAATACGDLRMAATGGVYLARVLRTIGDPVRARTILGEVNGWYEGFVRATGQSRVIGWVRKERLAPTGDAVVFPTPSGQ